MKPRIKLSLGAWVCYDQKFAGISESMIEAYHWWQKAHLNSRK